MSKKDNFSQAAYEMFGIGRGGSKREADKTAEKPAESAAMDVEEDEMSLTVAPTVAEVKPLEKVCPVGAISNDGSVCVIDADTCIECGACAGACPTDSITLD